MRSETCSETPLTYCGRRGTGFAHLEAPGCAAFTQDSSGQSCPEPPRSCLTRRLTQSSVQSCQRHSCCVPRAGAGFHLSRRVATGHFLCPDTFTTATTTVLHRCCPRHSAQEHGGQAGSPRAVGSPRPAAQVCTRWDQGSPTFLVPEIGFVEDSHSTARGAGSWDGLGMIQVRYAPCALDFDYDEIRNDRTAHVPL